MMRKGAHATKYTKAGQICRLVGPSHAKPEFKLNDLDFSATSSPVVAEMRVHAWSFPDMNRFSVENNQQNIPYEPCTCTRPNSKIAKVS